jgi:hypothetical protein
VFAPHLILDRERQFMDFGVFKTVKLAQFFGGIDLNPVDHQGIKSLEEKSKGTPGKLISNTAPQLIPAFCTKT